MEKSRKSLISFDFFQTRKDGPTYNVQDVWKMGFTGKGVVVAVVDEGLEKNHPELKQNFVSWVFFKFKQTVDKYIPNLI